MSWQDLGSLGEIISAIAVVVSLVYLAFQIRQNTSQIDHNTKAARASAFDSSIAQAMVARQAIFENEDVARIYSEGSFDPDALSEHDRLRSLGLFSTSTTSKWFMIRTDAGHWTKSSTNSGLASWSRLLRHQA